MAAVGTLYYIRVCAADGTLYDSVCTTTSGKMKMVEAYILDPSAADYLDPLTQPFDAAEAGAFFGFAFASTVFVWLLSLGAGMIIKMIRSS